MAILYVDIKNTSGVEDGSEEHPYGQIQRAIDAATAGDTLKVAAGVYQENVKVNKAVNIEGAGATLTTIRALDEHDDVFSVTSGNVKISGFSIIGGSGSPTTYPNGVSLRGVNNVVIANNVISNIKFAGVLLCGIAENNLIENNQIYSDIAWSFGIMISQARNNRIVNNIISKVYRGIKIESSGPNDGNVIVKNTITNIPYRAFEIWGDTSGIVIEHNNIHDNSGYNFYNCANSVGGCSPQNIKAPNNYWGTTDRSEIDAKIYDNKDNPAEGIVDYEPFLGTFFVPHPLGPLPVISIDGVGDIYARKLIEHGIVDVEDLVSADVPTLAGSVEVPMLKLYEWKRKAELALSVQVDCALLGPLLAKGLVDILGTSDDQLSNVVNQPVNVINDLKRGISTLLVSLDDYVVQGLCLKDIIVGPCLMLIEAKLMEERFEIDEKAWVNLTLKNVGSTIAENVVGNVISDLPKLKVLSGELNFGSILRGSIASAKVELEALDIEPGEYTLELRLSVKDTEYPMTQYFNVKVVPD